MKKTLSKILLSLLVPLGAISCTPTPSSSESESSSSVSSETSSSLTSSSEIDYVHNGSVALDHDYAGHDFYTDGIGQVSLKTPIDGDTAHFTPLITTTSGETIKSRFWGIDTPESTGQIQEWGKPASNFTKEQLTEADANGTIVVSSPFSEYKEPEHDSTGTRYVSLIWVNTTVKNAAFSTLILLNLYIVQEGYSWVKNVSDIPSYSDTFYAAQKQAENQKLHLFGTEPDPTFNYGDYQTVSLLDLKKAVVDQVTGVTTVNPFDNAKVTICGTVAGFQAHTLYLESYFDASTGSSKEGGEYAGINIYCGMSSIPSKYTKLNTYLQVSGVCSDSDTFGFQISGTNFPKLASGVAGEAEVLIAAEDNTDQYSLYTFQYKAYEGASSEANLSVISEGTYDNLYCATTLAGDLYCYNAFDSSDAGEHTLYLKSVNSAGATLFFSIYVTFTYAPDPDNPLLTYSHASDFIGHTYNASGIYGYHKTTSGRIAFQMIPRNSADLIEVS